MRKVLLFLAALAALAAPVGAQPVKDFFAGLEYDVDSATLTYCATAGPNTGDQLIMSSGGGSSANLVPSVAGSAPFTGMAVGDVLKITMSTGVSPSTYAYRVIITYTSANAVTVDSVITIAAGTSWSWYRNTCGTGATAGWFSVPAAALRMAATVLFEQGDITALVARWECRPVGSASIVILYPGEGADCGLGATFSVDRCSWPAAQAGTATGSLTVVDDAPQFAACRVGLAYTGADASDAAATLEKVTVSVSSR